MPGCFSLRSSTNGLPVFVQTYSGRRHPSPPWSVNLHTAWFIFPYSIFLWKRRARPYLSSSTILTFPPLPISQPMLPHQVLILYFLPKFRPRGYPLPYILCLTYAWCLHQYCMIKDEGPLRFTSHVVEPPLILRQTYHELLVGRPRRRCILAGQLSGQPLP